MKKFKWFGVVCLVLIIILCALVGCADDNKNVAVGKYYAEGSTESYIEVVEGNKAKFVNIDLSEIQADYDSWGENVDIAEVMSVPVPYEVADGHIYFKHYEGYALWGTWNYKNQSITFNGVVYTYQK